MSKLVKFDDEAYEKIDKGIAHIKRAVGATLGPRAHNVIYGRPFGAPGVVHDGVTVAKELDPKDPFEKQVVEHVKDAARATNDEAGDGTTTAVILTESLYSEGRKLVTAGHNAQMLRRGVEKCVRQVATSLEERSIPIETNDQQLQIAIISAQNYSIGSEVAKAFKKLGNEAVIAVEESKQNRIYSEYKDGMEIDQGYMSRYFLTSAEFDEAAVEKANILVTDIPLTTGQEMQQLFEGLNQLSITNNFVVICPEVKDIALLTLVQNKTQGLNTLAVKAPSFGDEQLDRLEDIATSVGCKILSKAEGLKITDLVEHEEESGDPFSRFIGHAEKVVSTKDTTTIVNGLSKPADVKARADVLRKKAAKETTSEFEKERLEERIAKLTSGVAVINVGARTEGEAKELKERTIDAVEAIKAANSKGIVAGGETALLRASWNVHYTDPKMTEEEKASFSLVARAMQEPFKVLMKNSGLDAGQMLERLRSSTGDNMGIDAIDGRVKDLVEAGVIDPVKVPISALLNATSAAMSLLTSGVIVVDEVKERDADVV